MSSSFMRDSFPLMTLEGSKLRLRGLYVFSQEQVAMLETLNIAKHGDMSSLHIGYFAVSLPLSPKKYYIVDCGFRAGDY